MDAFAPEVGESCESELASAPAPPPDFLVSVPLPDPDGNEIEFYVNSKYFGLVFASAESPDVAARLAATQRPFTARSFTDKAPAAIGWKTIPSWYVIGDADKVIRHPAYVCYSREIKDLSRTRWRSPKHDRASRGNGGRDPRRRKRRLTLATRSRGGSGLQRFFKRSIFRPGRALRRELCDLVTA